MCNSDVAVVRLPLHLRTISFVWFMSDIVTLCLQYDG